MINTAVDTTANILPDESGFTWLPNESINNLVTKGIIISLRNSEVGNQREVINFKSSLFHFHLYIAVYVMPSKGTRLLQCKKGKRSPLLLIVRWPRKNYVLPWINIEYVITLTSKINVTCHNGSVKNLVWTVFVYKGTLYDGLPCDQWHLFSLSSQYKSLSWKNLQIL